ncbi:MAG: cyclase family protein [Actinomycetota bacterium]|nr:cyclase family protein [Actinomycetota bacterium]
MTELIDVSLPIGPDLLTWPGDPGIEILPASRIADGDPANVSQLRLGSHTGTHVDPPVHFVEGGATADQLSLDVLVGDALVVELPEADGPIPRRDLEALAIPDGAARLLIKTPNSRLWSRRPVEFPEHFGCLSADAARWVVERGIRLVGIDFLSIESSPEGTYPVHHTLLEAGVIILEGLDLAAVDPGEYRLTCLPLLIAGGDGAPARAVLRPR